jgi:type I restriction enzyme S subunit
MVLSALDDRIALLRETNATLEAIAQALFKSWFVDFDPVHAKSQGLAPAGMDEATAALFPDGFEGSAPGQMPKGWRAGALSDCAWLNAYSWSTRTHPERVWYLDLANVKNNDVASMQDFAFEGAPSRARRALRDGDTIVGTVRPGNRSFAYIDNPIAGLTASTGFAVLSPKSPEFTAFTYLASTQNVSIENLAHIADGGAYPAVRPEVVSALPCVLPASDVLRRFDATARPMLQKIASNQRQAQALSALRDAVLPRLISGQLRLPEVVEAEAALA